MLEFPGWEIRILQTKFWNEENLAWGEFGKGENLVWRKFGMRRFWYGENLVWRKFGMRRFWHEKNLEWGGFGMRRFWYKLKTDRIINQFWLLHSQTRYLKSHYLFCTKKDERKWRLPFLRQCSWKVQLVWGDLITETKLNLKLIPWLSNCNIQKQNKLGSKSIWSCILFMRGE